MNDAPLNMTEGGQKRKFIWVAEDWDARSRILSQDLRIDKFAKSRN
jgi:hypothetical protein